MKKILIVIASILTSSMAFGSIQEGSKSCMSSDIDLCEIASSMESQISPSLPLQLNEILTMESIATNNRNVTIMLRLEKENGEKLKLALDEMEQSKSDAVKEIISERIIKDACNSKAMNHFIGLGGRINYEFLYDDDSIFSTINLSRCE